ncbi:glycosyltransferase [Acidiphilium sp. AL]|uniref:Glycosyltransferase n=1 Tax=Acidiphilium iwatense TaxID=768198 RepID=A0ABS9E1E2_9PROT|nr:MULTISPECIES: glycosyltransferase [Acidiphilium]MCF3948825.1 glycosyltransferase [Acidiphilium iwatense]MCU4159671.1 glycosyltransferase [Acidiphilium sp. AL]
MTAPVLLAGSPPPEHDYDADIVILSHHRTVETIAAIRSASAQIGCDHHVIVLDQDSPPEMRAALIGTVVALDRVSLYAIEANLGVPGGRNLATSLGRGRAIIGLDNDAVFAGPRVAASAAARLAADSSLAAIGFRILAADGVSLDATSWGYPKILLPRAEAVFAAKTFVGCGHALSRHCFETLDGYDASLFFCWEEYEFSRRAIGAGWRIEHHGDLAVIHAVSPEARVEWHGERWRYFVRNRLLIAHDRRGVIGMIPRTCLYLARGLRAGRLTATIAAIAEAVRLARTRRRDGNLKVSADASGAAMPVPTVAHPALSGRCSPRFAPP